MPCWFQECLEIVKALFTEWCSEVRSFRRLSNELFLEYITSKIIKLIYSTFYSKFSKFDAHFRTAIKDREEAFV